MPPLVTRCTDTVRFIAPSDPAVIWPADPAERDQAQVAYLEAYDTQLLKVQGQPIVWHIRPLYMQDMRTLARETPQIGETRIPLRDLPESQRESLASLVRGDEIAIPQYHEERDPATMCRAVVDIDRNETIPPPVWVGAGDRRRLSMAWALSVPPDIASDVARAVEGLSVASDTLKKSSFWRYGKA